MSSHTVVHKAEGANNILTAQDANTASANGQMTVELQTHALAKAQQPRVESSTAVPVPVPEGCARPKLLIDSNVVPVAPSTSPYTASPSGRLKLPPSAIMRSRSSSSITNPLPSRSASISSPMSPPPGMSKSSSMSFKIPEIPPRAGSAPVPSAPARAPRRDSLTHMGAPALSIIRERIGLSRQGSSDGSITPKEGGSAKDSTKDIAKSTDVSADNKEIKVDNGVKAMEKPTADDNAAVEIAPESRRPSLSLESQPGLADKARGLRLEHTWTLYFDSKGFLPPAELPNQPKAGEVGDYEKTLLNVGHFDTVEGFARLLNNIKLPSKLSLNSNYHMFKDGIKPMWEDPANAGGGKWVVLLRNAPHLLDLAWANLTMALIGEVLDPENQVCGIVVSTRAKVHRVQVWTRTRDNVESINLLGRRIVLSMCLEGNEMDHMSMEYQFNSSSQPPSGTYLSIPFGASGYRSTAFAHAPHHPSRLSNLANDSARMPPPPALTLNGAGTKMTRSSSSNGNAHVNASAMVSPSTASTSSTGRLTPISSHPSLPPNPRPRSPGTGPMTSPLSPSFGSIQTALSPPLAPVRRLSAGNAFAGPMGGKNGRISPSSSPQLPSQFSKLETARGQP